MTHRTLASGLTVLLMIAGVFTNTSQAQATRILMDGGFDDWEELAPAHSDAVEGNSSGTVDFGRLWMTNDEQFLFIRIEVSSEILIQEGNTISLYLDTDDDPLTGQSFHGIGAELIWHFGQRNGTVFSGTGSPIPIGHAPIGIVTGPTVSSTEFEIALALDSSPDGQNALFADDAIRLVLLDDESGDRLPDLPGGVSYVFGDPSSLPLLVSTGLQKTSSSDVRILSYNVQRDGLFDASRIPAYRRILRALSPDVIGFQEIYQHTAEQTATVVSNILPPTSGTEWFSARIADLVIVSRYRILGSYPIVGQTLDPANAAFVLDLKSEWDTDLLVLVAHPPCCRADEARQIEIDAMMAFVRDATTRGGSIDLEPDTPAILLGDMNLVGYAEQLNTLLTGQILNTGLFGPSFDPDWDGSPLADLRPRHVALPMTYTWYNEDSSFHPGRLDFMIYTDSVLEPANRFVLFTPAMPADSLVAHSLQSSDATVASDHLPLVGDFSYVGRTGTGNERNDGPSPAAHRLLPNYPDPFNVTTTIPYDLPRRSKVVLRVYDVLGRQIRELASGMQPAGSYEVTFNAAGLPSGVYFYRLQAGGYVETKRMVIVK